MYFSGSNMARSAGEIKWYRTRERGTNRAVYDGRQGKVKEGT